MIKISNTCLHQNSISIKFFKILKIHKFFCENPRIIFVLFYDVHKENMFTINLEDGREAPSNASFAHTMKKQIIFITHLANYKNTHIYNFFKFSKLKDWLCLIVHHLKSELSLIWINLFSRWDEGIITNIKIDKGTEFLPQTQLFLSQY